MSIGMLKKFLELKLEILGRGDGMNAGEASKFYDRLTSFFEDFTRLQYDSWDRYDDKFGLTDRKLFQEILDAGEYMEKKITRLQKYLRRFFEPVNKSTSSTELKVNYDQRDENDQPHTVDLNSLLQKQEFYIQMINLLVPEGEISSKKAELQYEHVSQLYERFMSNQSEIMTVVKDAAFGDQVKISKEVQSKVLSLQETLKEIFSLTKPIVLPESNVNEHFNRTERPNVIVDFLDSQYKKQKSLIEQIELIESKNDPRATEAETLFNHVSQLYDTFIKNQAKIETYVKGPALDKELEITREISVKVMSLQTKLKEIFAPVQSAPLLDSLLEKQKSLIDEIQNLPSRSYCGENGICRLFFYSKEEVNSQSQFLPKLKTWFIENQMKIEELVDDLDLHKQQEISTKIQKRLADIQEEYVSFLEK